MGAETGADAAMFTDDRFALLFVKEDRRHHAGADAFSAADALLGFQKYAAARTVFQSPRRASLRAGPSVLAGDADIGDKTPLKTAAGPDLNRAFG